LPEKNAQQPFAGRPGGILPVNLNLQHPKLVLISKGSVSRHPAAEMARWLAECRGSNSILLFDIEQAIVTLDNNNTIRYYISMIKSFAAKETEKIFQRLFSRRLPPDIQTIARRKLEILDAAEALSDLLIPPSNRLEKLSGDRLNQHSIRINGVVPHLP
jgi:proteic killer suppression protein